MESAKANIENGKYSYLAFGLNSSNSYTFGRLLDKKHGIKASYRSGTVYRTEE